MSTPSPHSSAARRLAPWFAVIVWTGTMGIVSALSEADHERMKTALTVEKARTVFQKDLSYRFWNLQVGALYGTLSNADLQKSAEERLQGSPEAKELTLINPGVMTRMIHEIDLKEFGLVIHLCSTRPVNARNQADAWETKALSRLQLSGTEYYELVPGSEGTLLRYIGALRVTQQCLNCHVEQSYKPGELRGGLSVTIPYDQAMSAALRPHIARSYVVYGSVWLLGLAGIVTVFHAFSQYERKHRETFEKLERREQRSLTWSSTRAPESRSSTRQPAPCPVTATQNSAALPSRTSSIRRTSRNSRGSGRACKARVSSREPTSPCEGRTARSRSAPSPPVWNRGRPLGSAAITACCATSPNAAASRPPSPKARPATA